MVMNIYSHISDAVLEGKKLFAVLVDPDKPSDSRIKQIAQTSSDAAVDFIFVGGSLLTNDRLDNCIRIINQNCQVPVVLFPGNTMQINARAQAILLLSLISGRNAEMLIGKHVIAAPYLKSSNLEVIPTGYLLIESGKPTAALYMSNSLPIPHDKDDIAVCTALAGEMLGLKLIYMDAGSGASYAVSTSMIRQVKNNITVPLIIGGGIKSPEDALAACNAGADIIVVGNAIEKNDSIIPSLAKAVHSIIP